MIEIENRENKPQEQVYAELRQLVGEANWSKALRYPKVWAAMGDYVWGVSILEILSEGGGEWSRGLELTRQAYLSGEFQRVVARRLGIEDEIRPRQFGNTSPQRVLSEILESTLGCIWFRHKQVPVELVRDMLGLLSHEELLIEQLQLYDKISQAFPGYKLSRYFEAGADTWVARLHVEGDERMAFGKTEKLALQNLAKRLKLS